MKKKRKERRKKFGPFIIEDRTERVSVISKTYSFFFRSIMRNMSDFSNDGDKMKITRRKRVSRDRRATKRTVSLLLPSKLGLSFYRRNKKFSLTLDAVKTKVE